ncbi:MAG TPA: hypothetical protein PLX69_18435 [Leptospiraceae bacterium]|nr:hypothetical protein [Leptospiraceae bacterium]
MTAMQLVETKILELNWEEELHILLERVKHSLNIIRSDWFSDY